MHLGLKTQLSAPAHIVYPGIVIEFALPIFKEYHKKVCYTIEKSFILADMAIKLLTEKSNYLMLLSPLSHPCFIVKLIVKTFQVSIPAFRYVHWIFFQNSYLVNRMTKHGICKRRFFNILAV